jgi:hypothetical protein
MAMFCQSVGDYPKHSPHNFQWVSAVRNLNRQKDVGRRFRASITLRDLQRSSD